MIERRYLPSFAEGDRLRLGGDDTGWSGAVVGRLCVVEFEEEGHYRLEAAYWLTPLPVDGLLTLVCGWPEIGLPETQTDLILPELAVRAAEAFPLWDFAEDADG